MEREPKSSDHNCLMEREPELWSQLPDGKRTWALITIAWWKENLSSSHNNSVMERNPTKVCFFGFLFLFYFPFGLGKPPFTCLGKFRKVEEIIPRPDMELAHKSTKTYCKKNTRASIYDTGLYLLRGVIRDTVKVWQWPIQSTSLHEGGNYCKEVYEATKSCIWSKLTETLLASIGIVIQYQRNSTGKYDTPHAY
jgi:hypothetical protein